jgi:hypothetical protein
MLSRWMGALFTPKYPRHYTGRHRGRKLWRKTDLLIDEAR